MTAVSVIVPAHNYARFLGDALDSVIAQTFDDWECIVVDDGSTDDTLRVAESYAARDARIRVIGQSNQGVSAARNTGLKNAAGELIQFLDADDRLHATKLERHVAFLRAHPETHIVYGEVTFFHSDDPQREMASLGGRLSRSIMARVHGAAQALQKLEHYNIMPINAALIRRTVIDRAGVFDERSRGCEDWDFWLRAAMAGCRFDFDDGDPVASVRAHQTSATRDAARMLSGLIAVARAFRENAATRTPLIYQVALGVDAAQRGERRAGFRQIWSAARDSSEGLTALRWRIYALGALLLPRALFTRLVTCPIPERPFEMYRRLRSAFRIGS